MHAHPSRELLDLEPADLEPADIEFARRSVRYLLDHRCSASQIIDALTEELELSPNAAHDLLSETTALVAA